MELDSRQTIIIAILVLFFGKFLNSKFEFLRKLNIPEPVSGGVLVSVLFGVIYFFFGFEFEFALHYRDVLLVVFFTTIGLKTKIRTLIKGGRVLLILMGMLIVFLFIQNLTGILGVLAMGKDINYGLIGGSIALSGGHGTTIAWAPIFAEHYGIDNAMEIGIAVATFGLVSGGIIAGPVANWLIKRNNLTSEKKEPITIGAKYGSTLSINSDSMLMAVIMSALAIGLGIYLVDMFEYLGVNVPLFVSSLIGGLILTNIVPLLFPKIECPEHSPTLSMVSDLSLGVFLAMSLMSTKLWELAAGILPILFIMVLQIIVIILFVVFVLFKVLGKDYEAAVMSAGVIGMGLGATPTAMANMSAISQSYGAAPKAFMVIPIVGAFFINFINAFVIELILSFIN
ncbi:MAG: sodium/glutamate symporter [Flavobacteriales bacterium]|nr:sodium/glutamate symporter [Flavobacteriales bacterium]